MKLDKIDRKLLYELLTDSRQSHIDIARKVRISPQSLDYRITKLEEQKIIHSFFSAVDLSKLGFTFFKVYIKTQNMNEAQEHAFVDYLVSIPFIRYIASCEAKWDYYFSIVGYNFYHFNSIWTQLYNKFSPFIAKKSIALNKKILRFRKRFLTLDEYPIPLDYHIIEWAQGGNDLQVTPLDTHILLLLSQDATLSTQKISQHLGISRKTVSSHLKRLMDTGIIFQFSTLLNLDAIGIHSYKILLKTNNLTEKKEQQLIDLLNKNPFVSHLIYCLGEWDLEIYVETPTVESNRMLIKQLRYEFSGNITDIDVIRIYKIHNLSHFSKEIKHIIDTKIIQ